MSDRELLQAAKETIQKQKEFIHTITAPYHAIGTVQQAHPFTVVVQTGVGLLELDRPHGDGEDYTPGQRVCLNTQTMQIERATDYVEFGEAGVIEGLDDGLFEVQTEHGSRFLKESRVQNLAIGDRVVMDSTGRTILAKVKPRESTHQFNDETKVSWDEIGGLRAAKDELRLALEEPIRNATVFSFFNKTAPRGFLLHGGPGNGKTLLGKASATAMGTLHGHDRGSFIYVKGPEILSKWVGESEETIRTLFITARQHKKRHGFPSVIFIDEADAILGSRSTRTAGNMEHTIVPQFLSEMDGLNDNAAVVLLATNRADMLDPAIVRPGRIDRKIHVSSPSMEDALEIFLIHLRNLPLAPSASRDSLVEQAMKTLYSDAYPMYTIRTNDNREVHFSLRELASGAFIAGIVEQATSFAVVRNLGRKEKHIEGLTWHDFECAFRRIHHEQYGMNHEPALNAFMEERGITAEAIIPRMR